MTTPKARRVVLEFRDDGEAARRDLSVVLQVGDDLWLAADETAALERLSPDGDGRYAHHRTFPLADFIDLPAGDDEEADIEGMAYDGRALWVVGSHSTRRGHADAAGAHRKRELRRLADVKRSGNRYLLARVPLAPDAARPGGRSFVPCASAPDDAALTAARLVGGRRGGALLHALRDDPHLAASLDVPSKENGFDVEGLAEVGGRLFIGLRGPVLDGWAVVLEVAVEELREGRLDLAPIGRGKRPYRKHLLDLRGTGVREISADGDSLLVLAGPTMKLDGDAALFRWAVPPAGRRGDTLTGRDALPRVLDLPYGRRDDEGVDHPEGLTLLRGAGGRREVLVAYDSPSDERRVGRTGVALDLFALP